MIYLQVQPQPFRPGAGTTKWYAAPEAALQHRVETFLRQQFEQPIKVSILDRFPAGVPISIIPRDFVC